VRCPNGIVRTTAIEAVAIQAVTARAKKPIRVTGRLVFHFAIRDGKPVVLDTAM
jgi:hypothetical protein